MSSSEDKCEVFKDKHEDLRKMEYFRKAINSTEGRKEKSKPPQGGVYKDFEAPSGQKPSQAPRAPREGSEEEEMTNLRLGNATCRPHNTPASQSPEFRHLRVLRSQRHNRFQELVKGLDMFRLDDRREMRTKFFERHRFETGKKKIPTTMKEKEGF
ncbi:hypothetical protein F2Q69_00043301 [Brassica cretica]|uniref:Uncharacterized protein n=1 Tax=Brassica cretica TaxID=69181 RepID=A0A8S9NSZ9_BRACR|nr:hypothetical protein F2Q69_00043301 [Brassica cretica]